MKQVGPNPEDVGIVSKGSYSYTAPDGGKVSVTWKADENGFQPVADHLPYSNTGKPNSGRK